MEYPFRLCRFSSDARWDLRCWNARSWTGPSDPSLARYEGVGGNWYDAEDVSEAEALRTIADLNEQAAR